MRSTRCQENHTNRCLRSFYFLNFQFGKTTVLRTRFCKSTVLATLITPCSLLQACEESGFNATAARVFATQEYASLRHQCVSTLTKTPQLLYEDLTGSPMQGDAAVPHAEAGGILKENAQNE